MYSFEWSITWVSYEVVVNRILFLFEIWLRRKLLTVNLLVEETKYSFSTAGSHIADLSLTRLVLEFLNIEIFHAGTLKGILNLLFASLCINLHACPQQAHTITDLLNVNIFLIK